jgi:hypothetical protein
LWSNWIRIIGYTARVYIHVYICYILNRLLLKKHASTGNTWIKRVVYHRNNHICITRLIVNEHIWMMIKRSIYMNGISKTSNIFSPLPSSVYDSLLKTMPTGSNDSTRIIITTYNECMWHSQLKLITEMSNMCFTKNDIHVCFIKQ